MNEDLINLIIFAIIMAFGVIANMVKARSEKSSKTDDQPSEDTIAAAPKDKPKAKSRLEKILENIPKPDDPEEGMEDSHRPPPRPSRRKRSYTTPGGFAEVMRQDRELEETLKSTGTEEEQQQTPKSQASETRVPDAKAAEEELDSLFTDIDDTDIYNDIDIEAVVERLPISQERLPDAVIYREILSKPLALREENEHIF